MVNIVGNYSDSDIRTLLSEKVAFDFEKIDKDLNSLSTEELLKLWQAIEQEVIIVSEELNKRIKTENKPNKKNDKLEILKRMIVHKLLSDKTNGLLDMLVKKEFPGLKINIVSVTMDYKIIIEIDNEEIVISIYPELNQILEFYNSLNSGGKSDKVAEVLDYIKNTLGYIRRSVTNIEDSNRCIGGEQNVLNSLSRLSEELEKITKIVKKEIILLMSDISHLEGKGYSLEGVEKNEKVGVLLKNKKNTVLNIGGKFWFDSIKSISENIILANGKDKFFISFVGSNVGGVIKGSQPHNFDDGELSAIISIFKKGYRGELNRIGNNYFKLSFNVVEFIVFDKNGKIIKNPNGKEISNEKGNIDYSGATDDTQGGIVWHAPMRL